MLEALNNRGNTLSALGRHDEAHRRRSTARWRCAPTTSRPPTTAATRCTPPAAWPTRSPRYDAVIAARPDIAQAHNNRARVLQDLGRHDEALAGYDRAVVLRAQVPRTRSSAAAPRAWR